VIENGSISYLTFKTIRCMIFESFLLIRDDELRSCLAFPEASCLVYIGLLLLKL